MTVALLYPTHTHRGLNEHANFERFWSAALTLFKVATNDNWTDIMVACMIRVRKRMGLIA